MGFDPFAIGEAAAGPLIAAGLFPVDPMLAIGLGASVTGQGLRQLGTKTYQTGASDADIARSDAAARSARGAQIDQQARREQQMVSSNAAQGNTSASGLAAADSGRVQQGAAGAYDALEADLAQNRVNALSHRGYATDVNGLGALGGMLTGVGSPLAMFGAAKLAGAVPEAAKPAAGAVAGAAGGAASPTGQAAAVTALGDPRAGAAGAQGIGAAQSVTNALRAGPQPLPAYGSTGSEPFGSPQATDPNTASASPGWDVHALMRHLYPLSQAGFGMA